MTHAQRGNDTATEGFNAVASDLSLQQRRMSAGDGLQVTESTHVVASESQHRIHVVLSRATVHVCDVEGRIECADWWWSGGIGHDTLRPRPRSDHGPFRSSLMTITSGFLFFHLMVDQFATCPPSSSSTIARACRCLYHIG